MTSSEPWHIELTGPARRALTRLPAKAVPPVVESFQAIVANPYRLGKPLKFELEGLLVARRGPYRIIYAVDAERNLVTVVTIGHREDVYRPR